MDYNHYWFLSPMIGEILHQHAVILCEPVNKKCQLLYTIITQGDPVQTPQNVPKKGGLCGSAPELFIKKFVDVNMDGPTRTIIKFPCDGLYVLQWMMFDNGQTVGEIPIVPVGDPTWPVNPISFEHSLGGVEVSPWKCIYEHKIRVQDIPDSLIFVSCDLLEAETGKSLWTRMLTDIDNDKKQIGLIHLGDQAYMDNVFKKCVKLVRKNGYNSEIDNQILRAFGKRYYDTWKPHAEILSLTSNYTIWDDHEIKNNITLKQQLPEHDNYVRQIAVDAYQLYQQSLHFHFNKILSDYSWHKRLGSTLLMVVERTSKIISVNEIIATIQEYNQIDSIKRLILCFSSAPIPRPHGLYGNLYNQLTGDNGTAETSKFWDPNDLADLYRFLFLWMDSIQDREVLVAGGDLHFGTYGIAKKGTKEIPVIISSPITNEPTVDRWLASKGMKGTHQIVNDENPISFTTVESKARRCYAIVNLNTVPMSVVMRYSTKKLPRNVINYYRTLISFM